MNSGKNTSRFEQVRIERIDLNEKKFAVAYPPAADERLAASIREFGLFVPVMLQEKDGGFRVVAGNRRIPAARSAGLDSVPAKIMGRDLGDKELYLLNVRENAVTRAMNDVERAQVLYRLRSDFREEDKAILQEMPLLGQAKSQRILNQYISLIRLVPGLKNYVVSHAIPIRVSSRIAEWAAGDQEVLYGLLEKAPMGGNALGGLLDLLEEIILRDGTSIPDVAGSTEVREVMEASQLTGTQKREKLKQKLIHMRYPMLTERMARVSELLQRGVSRSGIVLDPPAYLEGCRLRASFSFGSVKDLQEKAKRLGSMSSSKEIEKALRLLRVQGEE